MIRPASIIGITAFWIFTLHQFIQREFFNVSFSQISQEWSPITSSAIREDYNSIKLGEERIGFEYSGLSREENRSEGVYFLHHNSFMSFRLLGKPNEILIRGRAWLNQDFSLRRFTTFIQAHEYSSQIQGELRDGKMEVMIDNKNSPPVTKSIPISGPVFYSESLNQIWTPSLLRPGKEWTLKIFNPLLMSASDFHFRVERKENQLISGKNQEAFLVLFGAEALETRIWITPEGLILRKEMPNGLVLVSEPAWQIFDSMRQNQTARPDLPNLFSVPANLEIKNPRHLKAMSVLVKGPRKETTFDLRMQDLESAELIDFKQLKEIPVEFLQAEDRIPSADPELINLAQKITQGEPLVLKSAKLINEWVHNYITPTPTTVLSDAKQILMRKKGDCKEYSLLFTTLARAAGIPAQTVAGLVYANGRFFYHAWAAVYINQWIYFDPTFNQSPVDASHIPLVIGNLNKQAELAEQIGRLQVMIKQTSEEKKSAHATHS